MRGILAMLLLFAGCGGEHCPEQDPVPGDACDTPQLACSFSSGSCQCGSLPGATSSMWACGHGSGDCFAADGECDPGTWCVYGLELSRYCEPDGTWKYCGGAVHCIGGGDMAMQSEDLAQRD
jgi:hypothetical protein